MIATYYDLDMNEIDTKDLLTTNLEIPSIPFVNNWLGGTDGILPIHTGVDIQQRPVNAHVELISHDYLDYNLLKDYLYGIFGFNKPFYVVDKRQPYKRYRVVLDANFSPVRNASNNGSVIVPFITTLPYAESIGTTLDIHNNGISVDDELWGPGMGLLAEDNSLKYIHTTRQFQIYNAGNEGIHPFNQELKITIGNVSEAFELKNLTNGTTFEVTETVNGTVVLDGPTVTINDLQALRKTNREFIQLSPGWNEFEITTDATVTFDFRFYYS